MIASFIGFGAASALAGAVIYANLPTRLTIGAVAPTIAFLNQAPLKKIDSEKDVATAETVKVGPGNSPRGKLAIHPDSGIRVVVSRSGACDGRASSRLSPLSSRALPLSLSHVHMCVCSRRRRNCRR